jgi:predicted PolB exonuclease-like 3'-5' exonuclease
VSEGRTYLVVDIETVPDTTRWTRPEQAEALPPVRDAFPPTWAHRVVAIGCAWLDAGYRLARFGAIGEGQPDDERALLAELSRQVADAAPLLVTYNGRSFDLPVIALRALCHGVPLGWYYRPDGPRHRYGGEAHVDLADWLADHGATRVGSLHAVARLIGLPGKLGIDGSHVEGLYRAGQLGAIQRYCLTDVVQTALLFLRFQLLRGALAPAEYRDAAEALLLGFAADGRVDDVLAAIDRDHLLDAGPT